MSELTVTADRIVGSTLYATATLNKYRYPGGSVIGTFTKGAPLGVVYSYVMRDDGLYWMFYDSYNNVYYVKNEAGKIDFPGKKALLEQLEREADKLEREEKGFFQYNFDKYGKYVVYAIGLAIVAPSIISAVNASRKPAVSGVGKNDGVLLLLLLAASVYVYKNQKPKSRGSVIVHPLDEGEYVPDVVDETRYIDATSFDQRISGAIKKSGLIYIV